MLSRGRAGVRLLARQPGFHRMPSTLAGVPSGLEPSGGWRSAEEPGPGGGAPAVPGGAFADECPLGISGDVTQRVADIMEDGDVGVRALEVADEVEIAVLRGLRDVLVGPPQQAGYPRCRGKRVALVLHLARVVVAGQEVGERLRGVAAGGAVLVAQPEAFGQGGHIGAGRAGLARGWDAQADIGAVTDRGVGADVAGSQWATSISRER